MSHMQASLLMAAVVAARSIAYLFSKTLLGEIGPFDVMFLRFTLAFVILSLVFRKRLKAAGLRSIMQGAGLGILLAALMVLEMHALKASDTVVVSFLENSAVVFVPLVAAALFKIRLNISTIVCAGVALSGIALLTVSGGAAVGIGDAYALAAAMLYSLFIVFSGRFARESDPIVLGIAQMGSGGLICLLCTCAFDTPQLPQTAVGWGCLAVLVLVCSVFGFAFQPVAQRHISDVQAGMTCALNPVFASIIGVLALGESLSPISLIGAVLVLSALIASTALSKRKPPIAAETKAAHETDSQRNAQSDSKSPLSVQHGVHRGEFESLS